MVDIRERIAAAWESARNSYRHSAVAAVLLEVEAALSAGHRAEAEKLLVLVERLS